MGGSFSVSGPLPVMRRVFPGIDAEPPRRERALSGDALPGDLGQALQTVVVEAPPEFGPGNP